MMEFNEAQTRLANAGTAPGQAEQVELAHALGRILADDLTAVLDLPPADNSAMDGYAIRHLDYRAASTLPVADRVFAGDRPPALRPGTAVRLFTGSLLPAGADTVVMQEDTRQAADGIEILSGPVAGQHVRKRGEDTRAGMPLLARGTRLGATHIALLASQGLARVPVYRRLRVGILTTGDELVEPDQPRADQQIFNSNGAMLAALARGLHAEVTALRHAADTEASLHEAFTALAAQSDLILSVGGVSVGERDLVKPVLQSLGATLEFWKVRMRPGKPVALAHIGGKPVVCLPGNPVSAFAVFTLLVTPLMRRMQGIAEPFPPVSQVTLRTDTPRHDSRDEFLRVKLSVDAGGTAELTPYGHQGSGVVSSLPWASGLGRVPADHPVYDGEKIVYYDFAHWLA